jgi:hypothetical protein
VEQHDRRYYLGGDKKYTNALSEWLGKDQIKNEMRGVSENLQTYLLRHTRLIPRDIIILLNMLHLEAATASEAGKPLADERIRDVVSDAARLFGVEQMAIAGNQLAIGDLPPEAADFEFVELYTGENPQGLRGEEKVTPGISFVEQERRYAYRGLDVYEGDNAELQAAANYQRGIIENLTSLVREIGVDRFSAATFEVAQYEAERRFPGGRAMSVLWQNGLLGYTDGPVMTGVPVFYSATRAGPLEIPADRKGYVLHPCLIDALGVESRGDPIDPFVRVKR